MRILVTGGAGYIGSHFVHAAATAGHAVTVVDSLTRGFADAVDPRADLVVADVRDRDAMRQLVARVEPEAVVHFAGLAYVAESVAQPALYHDVNVEGTRSLLAALAGASTTVIFSSSCTVYGDAQGRAVNEGVPLGPTSPYGHSKLAAERIVDAHCAATGAVGFAFRYFNAGGAMPEAGLGERHDPEPHLIPNVIAAALEGRGVDLFGNDYATPDGTCVRDYVHVLDLAAAHLRGCELGRAGETRGGMIAVNLGSGTGHSNLAVVRAVEAKAGRPLAVRYLPRRPGDAGALFADNTRARQLLGFDAGRSKIEAVVGSAWDWHAGRAAQRKMPA